jgi:ABC-2 type transport system permease protein
VAYPIPPGDLFSIEVLLRVTAAIEMLIVMAGAGLGLLRNPQLHLWAPLVLIPYLFFNLYVATGLRDLISRLMARRRIREVLIFFFVMAAAAPQLLVLRDRNSGAHLREPIRQALDRVNLPIWPWGAAAHLADGDAVLVSLISLTLWVAVAFAFARWQFARSMNFDAQAASATVEPVRRTAPGSISLAERLYRIPSRLFADPLAALIEKEFRFLSRAPRFRMVFFMGFTFGMVIWLPILLRGGQGSPSTLSSNFLTVITLYSMLLLGEVCYWNSFGFDRAAAQAYFVFPIPIRTVLIAKNVAGLFFTFLEMTLITLVCLLLRMPVTPQRFLEATAVAVVLSFFLLAFGNLTSTHNPRPVDPAQSMRSGVAGRTQMVTLLIYPLSFLPIGLAYAARYAFASEGAFYAVLALDAGLGVIVYRIALESAVSRATLQREGMIDALAKNEGPMSGLGLG